MLGFRSLFIALAILACDAQKTNYSIGAWIPGTTENMLSTLRPLFEDFLNEKVGNMQSPPVRFNLVPVDFTEETSSYAMIGAGKLDFLCE
mmetsp:Transcript_61025/g.163891  ORF Transcript_61025/g.163891 Transcript_61025/m.163891 type:complete len:90 (+) Transcript_61025:71-340(+)